jgi:hypothetical protein
MSLDDLFQILKADTNTANALGAIASAVLALFALVVSIISVYVSIRALSIQRRHNILSVSPLPEITVADYENSLRLKIRNNGTGPLIVQNISFWKNKVSKDYIMEWMPKLPSGRAWTTFSHSLKNRTLAPNSEIIILELTEYENEIGYAHCRDLTRMALCQLEARVQYSDIYRTPFSVYVKKFDWFGRTLRIQLMINKMNEAAANTTT